MSNGDESMDSDKLEKCDFKKIGVYKYEDMAQLHKSVAI